MVIMIIIMIMIIIRNHTTTTTTTTTNNNNDNNSINNNDNNNDNDHNNDNNDNNDNMKRSRVLFPLRAQLRLSRTSRTEPVEPSLGEYLSTRVRAPVFYRNLREQTGETGFPQKPTGSLFYYRNLWKPPGVYGRM